MRRALLAAVLFVSYAYFYEAGGWNQNSRFDLTRAIVEQHRLTIDSYHNNTGDKSVRDGHYYADKAPGSSFVATPAVAALRLGFSAVGVDPQTHSAVIWLSYVAALASASVPGVIAALFLFGLARRWGAGENRAAIVALIFGLGTPFWAYATVMWGHALAGACLIAGLYYADRLRDSPSDARTDLQLGAAVGLCCGWAVVTEYPSVVPAAIISALALSTAAASSRERLWRTAATLMTTALLCATMLMVYQNAAFGSPFRLGYQNLEESSLMAAGFFGITVPSFDVMRELLFGSYRGLLPLAPALALAPFGWWLARKSPMRWTMAAAAGCFLFYFFMNAAYAHWEGGWCYGPRQMGAALAFLCLGLAPLMTRGDSVVRGLVVVLGVVGAVFAFVAVATTSQPPSETLMEPMSRLIWPQFLSGQLSTNLQSVFDPLWPTGAAPAAWNLGQKMGLTGFASLAPLLAVYAAAAALWKKAAR